MKSLTGKITLNNVRRFVKPIPVLGTVVVLGTAFPLIRRKGVVFGCLDLTLDILPIVSIAKGTLELFTGELIPDKKTVSVNDCGLHQELIGNEAPAQIERAA
ncbi:MAG TPA: hypothetical protein VFC63_22580 [Blastocatellia bacterium]|nr:hypothetical protein [Blastocatellia bacterium]